VTARARSVFRSRTSTVPGYGRIIHADDTHDGSDHTLEWIGDRDFSDGDQPVATGSRTP
jgi:hypothetical protein